MFKFIVKWAIIIGLALGFHFIPITYTFQVNDIGTKQIIKYKAISFLLRYITDSNDTIILQVTSPGGDSDIATELVTSMRVTKSLIRVEVTSFAASAATYIALNAHELQCVADSIFLFHRAYYDIDGKAILAGRNISIEDYNNWLIARVMPLLTESERIMLQQGVDIVMTCDTLTDRLKNKQITYMDLEFDKPNTQYKVD